MFVARELLKGAVIYCPMDATFDGPHGEISGLKESDLTVGIRQFLLETEGFADD